MRKSCLSYKFYVLILLAFISAPTIAATGWYLFVPLNAEEEPIDLNSPISKWLQKQAYDSAIECEAGKKTNIDFAVNFYFLSHKDYMEAQAKKINSETLKILKSTDERSFAYISTIKAGKCISSDDLHLRK